MNNIDKITEKIKTLNSMERNYIIYQLLYDNTINYNEISQLYVESLKSKNKEQNILLFGMSIPLITYFLGTKNTEKQTIFLKCKAAYHLLKSKCFHSANVEKNLEKYVKKYKYSEDKDGIHTMKKI